MLSLHEKGILAKLQLLFKPNDTLGMRAQMVGPARTRFHLFGRPNIDRLFNDPAYVLEDEIVVIPYGC